MVAVSLVSLVLLAVVADPSARALPVTGATTCPVPADVEAALTGLIPARDPAAATRRRRAEGRNGLRGRHVATRRRRADRREAPGSGLSCAQRARAAAVIVAAWEARLATPAAALVVQPPPAASPTLVVAPGAPPAMVLPLPENIVELGVSAGGSLNGTTLAPAVAVEVAYARAFARVVPAVAALFVGGHTMSVGWATRPGAGTRAGRDGRVATGLAAALGRGAPRRRADAARHFGQLVPEQRLGRHVRSRCRVRRAGRAAIASDALVAGRLHCAVAARPGRVRPGGTRYRDPAAGPGAGQPGAYEIH